MLELFRQYPWNGSDDGVTSDLLKTFHRNGWTGGGVELQNVLYRAAESCRGIIQLDDLPPYIHANVNGEQEPQ